MQGRENKHMEGRRREIVGDKTERADHTNRRTLALLLKPASQTPSITGPLRSFQRDSEMGTKVLDTEKSYNEDSRRSAYEQPNDHE